MNDGIFSNLARATRLAADHQCAGYRFWMVLHLLGCITLQNDADGVFIGIDTVEDFLLEGDPDDLYAVMHRDGSGVVVDIDHWPAFIGTEPLAALARDIALLPHAHERIVLIEAACFRLIGDQESDLSDVAEAVTRMRREGVDLEALDFPRPVHIDLGVELQAAMDRFRPVAKTPLSISSGGE